MGGGSDCPRLWTARVSSRGDSLLRSGSLRWRSRLGGGLGGGGNLGGPGTSVILPFAFGPLAWIMALDNKELQATASKVGLDVKELRNMANDANIC